MVSEYIYLAQVLTPVPNHAVKIIRKIRMGWTAFRRQSPMINDSLPFIPLKKKVYKTCILPLLTYRAETLRLSKRVQIKFRMIQRAVQWKVIVVTLKNKESAEWFREITRVMGILVEIKKKLVWQGMSCEGKRQLAIRRTEWVLIDGKRGWSGRKLDGQIISRLVAVSKGPG